MKNNIEAVKNKSNSSMHPWSLSCKMKFLANHCYVNPEKSVSKSPPIEAFMLDTVGYLPINILILVTCYFSFPSFKTIALIYLIGGRFNGSA